MTVSTMTKPSAAKLPFAPRPLSDVLGAEVVGFDVRDLNDGAAIPAVKDYLRDCQVLVFRDQDLSGPDMVAFSKLFGPSQYHILKQFLIPETPEIYVLSNIKKDGKSIGNPYEGIGWHTDQGGNKNPTEYTALYALEVPEVGGATCFASMYKAYEALPAERKSAIDGLEMITAYEQQYTTRIKFLEDQGITDHPYGEPLSAEQMESAKTRTKRGIVGVNPYNGRTWLYLATMGCVGVDGMKDEDGVALIGNLVEWATSSPFRYDHAWKKGDLVIWDNRGLFHVAGAWDKVKYRRHIWRCSIGSAD
jgi:taurine dioxygenase